MAAIARLGDTSNHGGSIISASPNVIVNGRGVARVGDSHSCPIRGHGVTAIVSTPLTTARANGQQIACVGATTGCGATISSGSGDTVTTA